MRSLCQNNKLGLASFCCLLVLGSCKKPGQHLVKPGILASVDAAGRGQLGVASAVTHNEEPTTNLTQGSAAAKGDCLQNVIQKNEHSIGPGTSSPILYAKRLGFGGCVADNPMDIEKKEDVDKLVANNKTLIFGGGNLFSKQYEASNEKIFSSANGPIVAWGVGFADPISVRNEAELPEFLRKNLNKVTLIGTREYSVKEKPIFSYIDGNGTDNIADLVRWVPDASALNPAFDKYLNIADNSLVQMANVTRHIGYIRPQDFNARKGCERTGTVMAGFSDWLQKGLLKAQDVAPEFLMIEDVLKFIAETDVIVTNSYHPAYWATLLGKKVIVCDRWSNEFDHLKWPLQQYSGALTNDALVATAYPQAMQEARDANLAFAEEVREKLGISESASPLMRTDYDHPIQSSRGFIMAAVVLSIIITAAVTMDTVRKRDARRRSLHLDHDPMSSPGDAPERPLARAAGMGRGPAQPGPTLSAPRLGCPASNHMALSGAALSEADK